jgi:hypothetical protein
MTEWLSGYTSRLSPSNLTDDSLLVLDMTGGEQYVGGSGGGRGGTGDCRREMGRCASLAWCTTATCYGDNILVQPGLAGGMLPESKITKEIPREDRWQCD